MYFHPLILTEAQKQQRLAAWEDMARVNLDVERQHRWHEEAFDKLFTRHREGARAVLEALDLANELANWSALAVRMPLQLLPISARCAEIAADLQRKVVAVADIYAGSRQEILAEKPTDGSPLPSRSAAIRAHAQRQQVMASTCQSDRAGYAG